MHFFFFFFVRLESPTRTLTMEAPRGVEVTAAQGTLQISGRKDLQLESTEGEVGKHKISHRLFHFHPHFLKCSASLYCLLINKMLIVPEGAFKK